jgi:pimeloyl-ACP methyl ester carboxylesterase
VFELGEDLIDQVQVRGVFRQEERALPLLLTHGWSGSVLEFSKVIGPLTAPMAHGGKASDAFHVIVPSLPGFGFSDKPQRTGWTLTRTAKAWAELMKRLGYNRYVAQGGDLGAGVTTHMGRLKPEGLRRSISTSRHSSHRRLKANRMRQRRRPSDNSCASGTRGAGYFQI